ncbi:hypothetical protein [Rhizobium sp. ZW T2_16]|uniref:hypothetical protein n=1 Tax=Rhizobium sp. ZW T2_16 TaxID=3378083 RepID=UPI0038538A7D
MSEPSDTYVKNVAHPPELGTIPIFFLVYFAALAMSLFDLVDGRNFLGDVDDQMRQMQIHGLLLGGGSWWDLSEPRVMMPEPYISPWSRLVDMPYVAMATAFSPFVGWQRGMIWSFNVWPQVMLVAFCLQSALIYRRLGITVSLLGILTVVSATLVTSLALWEFSPGRIDHHNAQLISLMLVFNGLTRWDAVGGRLIGLGTLLSVTIALEGLPFVVIGFAGLVGALILRVRNADVVVKQAAATMALLSLPVGVATVGPVGLAMTQCDAYSAPYVFLMTALGAILWLTARFLSETRPSEQLLAMSLSGFAVIVCFVTAFPQCMAGPYWMIDTVSRTYWFDRVAQEQSSLYFIKQGQWEIFILLVLHGSILTIATASILQSSRKEIVGPAIMLTLAWTSVFLTLLLSRYVRFAFAFSPLFMPMAMQYLALGSSTLLRPFLWKTVWACILGYVGATAWLVAATPVNALFYDAADFMAYDSCKNGEFSVLTRIPPGRIAASNGLGLSLLEALPHGFSVAAVPFHRASPGMRRMFEAFLTTDPVLRRAALAPFDYLAACRFLPETDFGTAPLYDALASGKDWPGLIRIPDSPSNPFQLFLIDHSALN